MKPITQKIVWKVVWPTFRAVAQKLGKCQKCENLKIRDKYMTVIPPGNHNLVWCISFPIYYAAYCPPHCIAYRYCPSVSAFVTIYNNILVYDYFVVFFLVMWFTFVRNVFCVNIDEKCLLAIRSCSLCLGKQLYGASWPGAL